MDEYNILKNYEKLISPKLVKPTVALTLRQYNSETDNNRTWIILIHITWLN